jgi:hypothetical protein
MAVTADCTLTAEWGSPDEVIPNLFSRPSAASVNIYGGAFVGVDASGNMRQVDDALCVAAQGLCLRQVLSNTTGTVVQAKRGAFVGANGTGADAISAANIGQPAYFKDANTFALTDTGARLWAGTIIDWDTSRSLPVVAVGMTYGQALSAGAVTNITSFRARAIVTTIDAYGGSGTGTLTETTAASGFGTQDGVSTLAVGDGVVLPAGTTNITAAKDAGPYVISVLGSATVKWVLKRPTWWATGDTFTSPGGIGALPTCASISIGPEGTSYAGQSWKSFAAPGQVVDTNDPLLYPETMIQLATIVSGGFIAITNCPLRTNASIIVTRQTLGGTVTSTVMYGPLAITTGALNTATFHAAALVAAGTANSADTSVVSVTILNR